jgi:hypothetical protein
MCVCVCACVCVCVCVLQRLNNVKASQYFCYIIQIYFVCMCVCVIATPEQCKIYKSVV